jgi:hypothetical protein
MTYVSSDRSHSQVISREGGDLQVVAAVRLDIFVILSFVVFKLFGGVRGERGVAS